MICQLSVLKKSGIFFCVELINLLLVLYVYQLGVHFAERLVAKIGY